MAHDVNTHPGTRVQLPPLVYSLHDGDAGMADLLGGKGANLGEMTRLGLPVPEGFVVSTTACREYLADGHSPVRLAVRSRPRSPSSRSARLAGSATSLPPCSFPCAPARRRSMPGMMETVLERRTCR